MSSPWSSIVSVEGEGAGGIGCVDEAEAVVVGAASRHVDTSIPGAERSIFDARVVIAVEAVTAGSDRLAPREPL